MHLGRGGRPKLNAYSPPSAKININLCTTAPNRSSIRPPAQVPHHDAFQMVGQMRQLVKLTETSDYAFCYCQMALLALEQSLVSGAEGTKEKEEGGSRDGEEKKRKRDGDGDGQLTTYLKFRRLRQVQ